MKANSVLFSDYYDIITANISKGCSYGARRLLEKLMLSIDDFPLSTALAVKFLTQFKDKKTSTRARYAYMLSTFLYWYNGERLPIKIKVSN